MAFLRDSPFLEKIALVSVRVASFHSTRYTSHITIYITSQFTHFFCDAWCAICDVWIATVVAVFMKTNIVFANTSLIKQNLEDYVVKCVIVNKSYKRNRDRNLYTVHWRVGSLCHNLHFLSICFVKEDPSQLHETSGDLERIEINFCRLSVNCVFLKTNIQLNPDKSKNVRVTGGLS